MYEMLTGGGVKMFQSILVEGKFNGRMFMNPKKNKKI